LIKYIYEKNQESDRRLGYSIELFELEFSLLYSSCAPKTRST